MWFKPLRTPTDGSAVIRGSFAARGRLLLVLYAISGSCGLTFEILWARQLGTVVGATSAAITAVVAVFMAGLALGSATGAVLATRTPRPAAWYGFAELGIGISALATSHLLPHLEALASLPARFALAAVLLLIPAALMGMTFPLVVEARGPTPAEGGRLYALNTAGAAFGCIAAAFLGLGLLGVRGTATVAALANLGCGLCALLFLAPSGAPSGAGPRSAPAKLFAAAPPLVLGVAFLAGLAALSAEILWTRALIPYLNSSTYAFAAILSVYLLALASGSSLAARRTANFSAAETATALTIVQALLAVAVAASPRLMTLTEAFVPGYVGVRRVMSVATWFETVGGVFLRTLTVIALPTLLMGASFPLCLRLASHAASADAERAGNTAGFVSAANTIGAILGSIGAGFLLLPAVGVLTGLRVTAAVNLIAAAIVALVIGAKATVRRPPAIPFVVLGAALALVLALSPGRAVPFVGRLAEGHALVLVDEGPQDTTAVVDIGAGTQRQRLIFSNGISYTGDNAPSRRYMRLLGHLPVLLADDPRESLVICVGTGMTAAAVARHPNVGTLDLVDISPVVSRTLPLFAHVNDRVFENPRVQIHEADGRQFMGRVPRNFGVITLEPPPPRAAGAASLYTAEIYQRAKASMRAGGMLAQWLPLHGLSETELWLLTRTFVRVFPSAALFVLNPDEAALIGSPGPLIVDLARLRERLESPAVKASLAGIGFANDDPAEVAAAILAIAPVHGETLVRLAGEGPIVTDDRPLAETFAVLLGAADGQRPHEEDGRNAFYRRVLAAPWAPLPTKTSLPPGYAAASAQLRAELEALAR
jgi:spermidine synthase